MPVVIGLKFDVIGTPAPQGSKRHVGNGFMVESSKANAPWRSAVASKAREAAIDSGLTEPLTGPLILEVTFRHAMPKSRNKTTRAIGTAVKTTAPDLDKLVRSVGDALTESGVIGDDALICQISASKVEVVGWTGAHIWISQLPDELRKAS